MIMHSNKKVSRDGGQSGGFFKNGGKDPSETSQNFIHKSKHLFKDQSVFHQEDAVTADPYMDGSRNSGEKSKQKTKRSASQSKSPTKNFSTKRDRPQRGSSGRKSSPTFQSGKKIKRDMSTRSRYEKNEIATSKLAKQMSSVYCGLGTTSQISSQYLGSNKNRQKAFAKADSYNVRQLAKRSNIPNQKPESKGRPHDSLRQSEHKTNKSFRPDAQSTNRTMKNGEQQVYDVEALDYEDVSIYTRGPMENQSINVPPELMIHDSMGGPFGMGISPRKNFEGNQTMFGGNNNKKTVLIASNTNNSALDAGNLL